MQIKINKRRKPLSPKNKKILKIFYGSGALLIVAFSAVTIYDINHLKPANNYTPAEVYKITRFNANDTGFLVKLKDQVLDQWILNGSSAGVKVLKTNEAVIQKLTEGKFTLDEATSQINSLKKLNKQISDKDINQLWKLYFNKRLEIETNDVNNKFQFSNPEDNLGLLNSANSLIKLDNAIISNDDMSSVSSSDLFNSSITSLNLLNSNINEVNSIKTTLLGFQNSTTLMGDPSTKWGKVYEKDVNVFNSYINAKNALNTFNANYKILNDKLDNQNSIIKNSVNIPDLSGLKVSEAKDRLNQIGLSLSVSGAVANSKYKDGTDVPDNNQGNVDWDNNSDDIINYQRELSKGYVYALKNSTLHVSVTNQSIDKPKPKPKDDDKNKDDKNSSSSSSSSDSSSSSSSSTSSSNSSSSSSSNKQ